DQRPCAPLVPESRAAHCARPDATPGLHRRQVRLPCPLSWQRRSELLRWQGPSDSDLLAHTEGRHMSILTPDIAIMEKILRLVVVYLFLVVSFRLVSFRLAGKRLLGQLTAFDLVVLLIISNVLQNATIGDDRSLGGGLFGAFVIMLLNWLVAWLTYRHKRLRRLVENVPTVLIRHGEVLQANLDREHMSMA